MFKQAKTEGKGAQFWSLPITLLFFLLLVPVCMQISYLFVSFILGLLSLDPLKVFEPWQYWLLSMLPGLLGWWIPWVRYIRRRFQRALTTNGELLQPERFFAVPLACCAYFASAWVLIMLAADFSFVNGPWSVFFIATLPYIVINLAAAFTGSNELFLFVQIYIFLAICLGFLLGYSFRYYATVMNKNAGIKLLAVEGVEPTVENIRNGSYPLTIDFYAVTVESDTGAIGSQSVQQNVTSLIAWLRSKQGQAFIEQCGYVGLAE